MTDADSAPTRTAFVVSVVILLGMCAALYLTFTEPFGGTEIAFAGRVLGPIAVMSIALSLLLRGRARNVGWVVAFALAATALALVIAG